MTNSVQIVRRKSSVSRSEFQPEKHTRRTSSSSVAEMAGGTTAGVAAIACCAPYSVANLLVLATYKMPAGLCRKAIRQRRRRRIMKNGMVPSQSFSGDGELAEIFASQEFSLPEDEAELDVITEEEIQEIEKEMWEHFSSAGFWRSPSIEEA